MTEAPADRVRTLLLRGDNLLKSADASRYGRARAAFDEAALVARDPVVEERVRALIERRLEALDALEGDDGRIA